MIDIHSHILPCVDDGSKSFDMSYNILSSCVAEGVSAIVCTPHQNSKVQNADALRGRFEEFKQRAENFPVKLYLGAEIYYFDGVVQALNEGRLLTLNDTRYVLVEFSTRNEMVYIPDAVYSLSVAGYKPIVAHAERYASYLDKSGYAEIKENGGLIQVNAPSFQIRERLKTIKYLLKRSMVDFIASDCHNDTSRGVDFSVAKNFVKRRHSRMYERFFGSYYDDFLNN